MSDAAPLLLSAEAVGLLLGVSRSTVYSMHACGELGPRPIHLGRRTLWNRKELESWTDAGCPSRDVWKQGRGQ